MERSQVEAAGRLSSIGARNIDVIVVGAGHDTYDISAGPICRIELPFMVGWTPHGHWMDFR